jgi:6-phosphogluconolactonase
MVAPDFKGKVSAADIHVSPDGKFLYASNRGEANELAIYSIDKAGKLTFVGRQSVSENSEKFCHRSHGKISIGCQSGQQ